jgi:hypothetical protein
LQKDGLATQINGRVADNTLQQFVLFFVGKLGVKAGGRRMGAMWPMISV